MYNGLAKIWNRKILDVVRVNTVMELAAANEYCRARG